MPTSDEDRALGDCPYGCPRCQRRFEELPDLDRPWPTPFPAALLDCLAALRSLSYLLDDDESVLIIMFSRTTTCGDYQAMANEVLHSSAWPAGWEFEIRKVAP